MDPRRPSPGGLLHSFPPTETTRLQSCRRNGTKRGHYLESQATRLTPLESICLHTSPTSFHYDSVARSRILTETGQNRPKSTLQRDICQVAVLETTAKKLTHRTPGKVCPHSLRRTGPLRSCGTIGNRSCGRCSKPWRKDKGVAHNRPRVIKPLCNGFFREPPIRRVLCYNARAW